MFDWNDLRYLLAIAREGSTLAAAKALGVSQPTVQRRLAALEERIGRKLVEHHPTGYRLTELGAIALADWGFPVQLLRTDATVRYCVD